MTKNRDSERYKYTEREREKITGILEKAGFNSPETTLQELEEIARHALWFQEHRAEYGQVDHERETRARKEIRERFLNPLRCLIESWRNLSDEAREHIEAHPSTREFRSPLFKHWIELDLETISNQVNEATKPLRQRPTGQSSVAFIDRVAGLWRQHTKKEPTLSTRRKTSKRYGLFWDLVHAAAPKAIDVTEHYVREAIDNRKFRDELIREGLQILGLSEDFLEKAHEDLRFHEMVTSVARQQPKWRHPRPKPPHRGDDSESRTDPKVPRSRRIRQARVASTTDKARKSRRVRQPDLRDDPEPTS